MCFQKCHYKELNSIGSIILRHSAKTSLVSTGLLWWHISPQKLPSTPNHHSICIVSFNTKLLPSSNLNMVSACLNVAVKLRAPIFIFNPFVKIFGMHFSCRCFSCLNATSVAHTRRPANTVYTTGEEERETAERFHRELSNKGKDWSTKIYPDDSC